MPHILELNLCSPSDNMTNLRITFFTITLTLALFFTYNEALPTADMNDTPYALSHNYTHVCDPSRFADLGLDMSTYAYCDASLPYDTRVKDLIDRMTLEEKVQQIGDTAFGVPRIGLPKYEWWSEALHGVSNVHQWNSIASFFDSEIPGATSFPTPICTVSSFNKSMWKAIGEAVSTEARAMFNLGHAGLTFWSPNINVVRDPRWGRAIETPGEDPFVVGTYASNYVRGLQDVEGTENITDPNSRPLKVGACCKHYAAYDVDAWYGVERYYFDSRVTEQDMAETFVKPFEMCVKQGDVVSVMCSYNRINGIPVCADRRLLKDTIRGKWDLHGYIVADCDAVETFIDKPRWLNDSPEDGVAQSLKAGLDLDCGNYYTNFGGNAVLQGKVSEVDIDSALRNLYVVLMRLGFFDGSPQFETLNNNDICTDEHTELAAEAAREGVVLLKNDDNILPLSTDNVKTIAVIGPHGNATDAMIGNYAGIPCKYTTPLQGFSAYGTVKYEMGCNNVACDDISQFDTAVQAAKQADATVLLMGLDLSREAESLDRTDLLLPGNQSQLINQVASAAKNPVVLVIMSAGGVDISFAKNNSNIKGILWVGYPGEEGGQGIADVVFGKHNPGGKLPLTWHENSYVDMLPMTSLRLRPIDSLGYPGRTYKFFNGSVVYPFGYGLSYTNFTYKVSHSSQSLNIKLSKFQHCRELEYTNNSSQPSCAAVLIDDLEYDDKNIEFEVEVKNVGKKDGRETLILYYIPPAGIKDAPIKQVIGFEKVHLAAGKSQKVAFKVNACDSFGVVSFNGYNLLPAGSGTIVIGDDLLSFPVSVNFQR